MDFNDTLRQLFIDFKHDKRSLGDTMRIAKNLYYGTLDMDKIVKENTKETDA